MTDSKPLTAGPDGIVQGFAYHDGYLRGVLNSEDKTELHIRSIDGEQRIVFLHGVQALRVDGFREGNIISNLSLFAADETVLPTSVLDRLREELELDPRRLPPNSFVFTIDTSYGAQLIAVCQRAEVSDVLG